MENEYKQFKKFKDMDREAKIKSRSLLTLEYYELLGKMLDDPAYNFCNEFLWSVTEFIETKEYISDSQIQAVQNIIEAHNSLPF